MLHLALRREFWREQIPVFWVKLPVWDRGLVSKEVLEGLSIESEAWDQAVRRIVKTSKGQISLTEYVELYPALREISIDVFSIDSHECVAIESGLHLPAVLLVSFFHALVCSARELHFCQGRCGRPCPPSSFRSGKTYLVNSFQSIDFIHFIKIKWSWLPTSITANSKQKTRKPKKNPYTNRTTKSKTKNRNHSLSPEIWRFQLKRRPLPINIVLLKSQLILGREML